MKRFIYFQDCEGGMYEHFFSNPSDLAVLIPYWNEDDDYLIRFAEKAVVGEFKSHSLGTLVRVKDD